MKHSNRSRNTKGQFIKAVNPFNSSDYTNHAMYMIIGISAILWGNVIAMIL